VTLADGDGQITVLTSVASLWSFGIPATFVARDRIAALESLVSALPSLGSHENVGLRNALLHKLEDADDSLARAEKSLAKGKAKDASNERMDAIRELGEFVHKVSDDTTRPGHTGDPISPADATSLIDAALQIEKLAALAGSPDHDQIVELERLVYLAPDLADRQQDGLRYRLAERLEDADQAFLEGEERLGAGDQRGANGKFQQAQHELDKFIEQVLKSTENDKHPADSIGAATAANWNATAEQIQVTIGALIQ
jgi:hypothetical protein